MQSMREHRSTGQKATMMMSGDDKVESLKQNTALARTAAVEESRKVKEENNNIKERELEERRKTEEELLLSEVEEEIVGEETKKKGVQDRIKLTHTALAAIRTQASNRQASAVATGLVQDLINEGLLPSDSAWLAVDPKKMHGARDAVMKVVQAREVKKTLEEDIKAIMVDAKILKPKLRFSRNLLGSFTPLCKMQIFTP